MDWKALFELCFPAEGISRPWSTWVAISVLCGWMFMWWSIGAMPQAFGAGFAKAEDSRLNTQLILEGRLLEVKRQQCSAQDNESLAWYTQEVNRLMALYREKLGVAYNEPPCSAVIVTRTVAEN